MSYEIKPERLLEDEKDILDSLGVELGRSSAKFTRGLKWDELTVVFAIFVSLRKRHPKPTDSHINFAIGDCLVEMERLFGKSRMDQFTKEFLRLWAFRDHVLGLAGAGLIFLQRVEGTITMCCAMLKPDGVNLSIEQLFAEDPRRRYATLGQMKRALVKTVPFSTNFEADFNSFVEDRNRFVHSLWAQTFSHQPVTGLPTMDSLTQISDFIRELMQKADRVERVFRGFTGAMLEAISQKVGPPPTDLGDIRPWLKYIPEFKKVLRSGDPNEPDA